jgi:two-component system, NtrC family, nitrogen regulation response regulator NtrX
MNPSRAARLRTSFAVPLPAAPPDLPVGEIRFAAAVDVPVLVTSPKRDERDLCARLIHAASHRGSGPFVIFSPEMTAALQMHARGPSRHRHHDESILRHRIERARGGTLFIDDVLSLTPKAQCVLLALLEERAAITTVDPSATRPTVRVIAGASHHADTERSRGAFNDAVFYRLNVVHLDLTKGLSARPQ